MSEHRSADGRRRLPRAASAVVVALLLVVGLGSPAGAAGTGGIEVTPVPAELDGRPVSSFRVQLPGSGSADVPFVLRNVAADGPRSARVYLAPVTRAGDGFVLGEEGTSPWVQMPRQDVTLQVGEVREQSFQAQAGELPDGGVLAAVVVEVQNGAIVQRASTLVYLDDAGRVPLPVLLVGLAALLLLVSAAAVALAVRRRS